MVLRDGELKLTVLCFVFDRSRKTLLMIHKKRGQGAGKVNVPGGKIRTGESAAAAAIRETIEETGIHPLKPRLVGQLEFYFPENENWDNHCFVFVTESFSGDLNRETEECSAYWESVDGIPLEKMWSSDRRWLPLVLSGQPFHRAYVFDAKDEVREEKVLHSEFSPDQKIPIE